MKFLKQFSDFILFGNIYVALGAACLIQSTLVQIDSKEHLVNYSILAFFSTLFVYNLQRIFYKPQQDKSLHSIRRKWIFENQFTIKSLALIGFSGVSISFFFNDLKIIFYLSPLLILSLAYFLPAIKLRKSPWFKLLTLVLVWTMVTAVVPILLDASAIFTQHNLLHILVRFIFMLAICIPFDVRDLLVDAADRVSTIPHLMGETKTRWFANTCMFIYILLIILEFISGMFNLNIFYALLISALINTVIVFRSNSKRSEYFYVAGIDGTMILQGVLLMIADFYL
ncbi:MAG: hypothetical protein A3F72_00645 [Bacteroidetes bacterium RIFCSPLOWO2_12_FULL_35_15]|nr:MAG: hypothetical protein A3F72_00645 [Bacteroidetes bacterium RIFCSPLOWO2_12_FULL_35_15]